MHGGKPMADFVDFALEAALLVTAHHLPLRIAPMSVVSGGVWILKAASRLHTPEVG